jgi:hypothetical protein
LEALIAVMPAPEITRLYQKLQSALAQVREGKWVKALYARKLGQRMIMMPRCATRVMATVGRRLCISHEAMGMLMSHRVTQGGLDAGYLLDEARLLAVHELSRDAFNNRQTKALQPFAQGASLAESSDSYTGSLVYIVL